MDLIDKIIDVITGSGVLKHPQFDLHFDKQQNVSGYISDEIFEAKTASEQQKLIWNIIRKNLESIELIKVLALFTETPKERIERLTKCTNYVENITRSNFWIHKSTDLSKYWVFVDIVKVEEKYKSFFLIINDKDKYRNGLVFNYPKEVIEFMELEQPEIYDELYLNIINNVEAEIKTHIIHKYDQLTAKGIWGGSNNFYYVFENFKMDPIIKSQLLFNEQEVDFINNTLDSFNNIEYFGIINDIKSAINRSKMINASKDQY